MAAAAASWDYISQLSATEQNPIRCCCVRAGDITLSSPGWSGRTERARREGGSRSARPVFGRTVQLPSLLSAAAAASVVGGGWVRLFPKTSEQEEEDESGAGARRSEEDDGRVLGAAVKDWKRKRRKRRRRWLCMYSNACAVLSARNNQQVVFLSFYIVCMYSVSSQGAVC